MANNINDEDVLGLLNRLLEQLHQAGYTNHGSKIEVVYVAPGAQYVNHIDTQIFGEHKQREETPPKSVTETRPTPVKDTPPSLPPELSTPKAMALWKKVQAAGYVDENYLPLISRTQAALLAYEMAKRLNIRKKWKVFEALWNRKNMYRDYYKALYLQQSLTFQDEIKKLFR